MRSTVTEPPLLVVMEMRDVIVSLLGNADDSTKLLVRLLVCRVLAGGKFVSLSNEPAYSLTVAPTNG